MARYNKLNFENLSRYHKNNGLFVQWRSQPDSDARAQIFYSQHNYMSRRWAHFHEGPKIMHIQYNLS